MKKVVSVLLALSTLLFAFSAAPGEAQSNPSAAGAVSPSLFDGMRYRTVGPSRGGRVTTVAGHPSHPETFYMGTVGGGIWKTSDYGQSWRPISDGYLATGSLGAIRVAPSDPDIVYAGTGSDGIRSNVITGKGVYRSDDAGQSWRFIGLPDAGQIGAVEVHPDDPEVVFVAAMGNAFAPNPERSHRTTRMRSTSACTGASASRGPSSAAPWRAGSTSPPTGATTGRSWSRGCPADSSGRATWRCPRPTRTGSTRSSKRPSPRTACTVPTTGAPPGVRYPATTRS